MHHHRHTTIFAGEKCHQSLQHCFAKIVGYLRGRVCGREGEKRGRDKKRKRERIGIIPLLPVLS